ncbi:MAG: ectoine hydroxylase-related dioxygenase (phytanoyl-CoA dioxygenase family) [Candidatus Latescibacterota bacterium]|jgi:ectoine hydroxylase-related dioxygenase (phytanoyl-CoA dioxygenase family)
MSFIFSDQHIEAYRTLGYTVFRQILPASLVGDLRRVTDEAREVARREHGPQAQRLQPVSRYGLDQQPFIDYAELAVLKDAIHRLLSPAHNHGNRDIYGILFEPATDAYCTPWHRDWRDNASGLDLARWDAHFSDDLYFNQVNCALYADSSTWVVPGSHLRRDLAREIERFPRRPISRPLLEDKNAEEREYLCLDYVRSMPGAAQLHLEAGDFCLYRNTLWHIGNYVPYRRRATLHDAVDTAEFAAWREETLRDIKERNERGLGMENANA